jgi:SNF2 family DNA or RNA helicase
MLYLTERALKQESINCVRLDGTIPAKDKKRILDDFRNNHEISVLLISIGAGSVG